MISENSYGAAVSYCVGRQFKRLKRCRATTLVTDVERVHRHPSRGSHMKLTARLNSKHPTAVPKRPNRRSLDVRYGSKGDLGACPSGQLQLGGAQSSIGYPAGAPSRQNLTARAIYVLVLFMSNITDMTERHRHALTELAELGMSLARKIHAQAETVEDVERAAELSLAFHRVSRSIRQTVALEAKLERDALHAPANDHQAPAAPGPPLSPIQAAARMRNHTRKLREAVEKLIYETLEREDADFIMEDVDFQLASRDPAIMSVPVEAYIARLKRVWDIPDAANQSDAQAKPKAEPSVHSSA